MNAVPPDDSAASAPVQQSIAAEYRRELLLLNQERIEFAYLKALANGMEDPVILVLDLQDERAAELAQATGLPSEQLRAWREECERCDVVPTQLLAAPRWAVLCVVGPTTPGSPRAIAKANPLGTFRVIAMAAGGNSFADFPLPPESHLGLQ